MANVLDRIMQRVDIDTKDNDKAAKAYSNMLIYLKELKLHNVKNLELAEQIHTLSETNVDKLNEIHDIISARLSDENETEKNTLTKLITLIEEMQQKTTVERDNDVRVLKREMAVLNSNMEENIQAKLDHLEDEFKKTRKILLVYMHVIIWLLVIIVFFLVLRYIPII